MTVISGMIFNEREGALVADEQASTHERKYDISTKIHELLDEKGAIALMGGSGASDVLYDVVCRTSDYLQRNKEKIFGGRSIAAAAGEIMSQVKRQYIDGYLKNLFGISEAEFHTGLRSLPDGTKVPIHDSLMRRYHQIIEGHDSGFNPLINNAFIVLTYDGKIQLFRVSMGLENPIPTERPYDAIGTGADKADDSLSDFFEDTSRDERKNTNKITGLSTLLYATERASVRNVGVGGTPYIKIIDGGKVITPNEANSRLAAEIVRGTKRGHLPQEFEREALEALLYNNGNFETFEKAIWEKATNKEKLSLLLRRYKV